MIKELSEIQRSTLRLRLNRWHCKCGMDYIDISFECVLKGTLCIDAHDTPAAMVINMSGTKMQKVLLSKYRCRNCDAPIKNTQVIGALRAFVKDNIKRNNIVFL